MRASAVGTCVWLPNTAATRPSRYQPMACFSLVASACMSTTTGPSAPFSMASAVRNGQSMASMKVRPCRLRTGRPLRRSRPRVLHRLLDLLAPVARQAHGAEVVDRLRPNDDAHLAAGLDGEGLVDAAKARRDRLPLLPALDVGLQRLHAGAKIG